MPYLVNCKRQESEKHRKASRRMANKAKPPLHLEQIIHTEDWYSFKWNTKELMHCYYGTNNRAPRWTFTDPCRPEVRPGAREESASPAWLAAPAMNARDTTKVFIWRLDTGCGPTLYRKCHSHNTPVKRHNKTWVSTSRSYLLRLDDPASGLIKTRSSGLIKTRGWILT